MKYVAITGGIGSGKSYICKLLADHGVRVYDCDIEARRLMNEDKDMQEALCHLVGKPVFQHGILQKSILTHFLLASEDNQQAVNEIIHPAVAADFKRSGYTWLESAILFDSGFDRRVNFSYRVCVSAPLDIRVERIMHRNGISRSKALEWVRGQMPQDKVAARCDFVIVNDGSRPLASQVERLLSSVPAGCLQTGQEWRPGRTRI